MYPGPHVNIMIWKQNAQSRPDGQNSKKNNTVGYFFPLGRARVNSFASCSGRESRLVGSSL